MKNLKLIALLGLGFMTIQSCSKESELCQCTDMATEILKGEREKNYDGSFQKEYVKTHKAEETKCEKIFGASKDQASQDKMRKEMKECGNYEEFKEESIKQMENFKKTMPEIAPQIDKTIEELKAD